MKDRVRVENRVYIDDQTRMKVLNKSKGVCTHCGKKLKIGENFSVDHAVPLNIGGTNDIKNLVPLCKECNFDKDDKMMPVGWYKCLLKNSYKELEDYIKIYEKEHKSVGYNYFMAYDKVAFHVASYMKNGLYVKHTRVVKKAYYSDLNEVYNRYIEYFNKFDVPYSCEEIKKQLSDIFIFGAIYVSNDMTIILPVVPFGASNCEAQGILFWYPYVKYSKTVSHLRILQKIMDTIIYNMKDACFVNESEDIPFCVWMPAKDTKMCDSFSWVFRDFSIENDKYSYRRVLNIITRSPSCGYKEDFFDGLSGVITERQYDERVSSWSTREHKISMALREKRLATPDIEAIREIPNLSRAFKNTYKSVFVWDYRKEYLEGLETGVRLCFADVCNELTYTNGNLIFRPKDHYRYGTGSITIDSETFNKVFNGKCFSFLVKVAFGEKVYFIVSYGDACDAYERRVIGRTVDYKIKQE